MPLFADCSKTELRELAQIADELDLREGTVLTREGRPGREFFVLIDGTVHVTKDGKKIADLGAGDWLGEIALLTDTPSDGDRHGDLARRRARHHRSALPERRRDDAVDRAKVLSRVSDRLTHDAHS